MRKLFCLPLILALLLSLTACGGGARTAPPNGPAETVQGAEAEPSALSVEDTETDLPAPSAADGVDVDLTTLSATMVYAEVFNMLDQPDRYLGKTIRMRGQCSSAYYEETDTTYYTILIADATACCAQGMEYLLDTDRYPDDGTEATVVGTFEMYEEFGVPYCRLRDAVVEV